MFHAQNINQNALNGFKRHVSFLSYLSQTQMRIFQHHFLHFGDDFIDDGRSELTKPSIDSRPSLKVLYLSYALNFDKTSLP